LRVSPLLNVQGQSSSNLNAVLRRALPVVDLFPHRTLFDYESTEPGDIPEVILVNSNSIPVKLSPGRWYVGVYNTGTNVARYRIGVAYEKFPQSSFTDIVIPTGSDSVIIPLTNQPLRSLTNFYRFVSDQTNAAVLFELFGVNKDADLILKRSDLPSPDLYEFSFLSTGPLSNAVPPNPGSEPLPLRTNIFIPHLNATNFFLHVLNRGGTVGASNGALCVKVFTNINPIVGCEFNAYISQPAPGGSFVDIVWDAVPGTRYTVEKTVDLINWTVIAGPITAIGTPERLQLLVAPTSLEFYRVRAE
jgi:hypothetical protein